MRPSRYKPFPFWAILACTLLMLTNAHMDFTSLVSYAAYCGPESNF